MKTLVRPTVSAASEPSEEFETFDKARDKIMSVPKEELDRRLAAAKKAKKGKRYYKRNPPNGVNGR